MNDLELFRYADGTLISFRTKGTAEKPPADPEDPAPAPVPGDPIPVEAYASADDGNVAGNVLDGDRSTRWSASGNGQWNTVRLQESAVIGGVDIAFYQGDTRKSTFEIAVSPDGQVWTKKAKFVSSGLSLDYERFNIEDVSAAFIRYIGYGNSDNSWNSVTGIRPLGADETPAAPASLTVTPYPTVDDVKLIGTLGLGPIPTGYTVLRAPVVNNVVGVYAIIASNLSIAEYTDDEATYPDRYSYVLRGTNSEDSTDSAPVESGALDPAGGGGGGGGPSGAWEALFGTTGEREMWKSRFTNQAGPFYKTSDFKTNSPDDGYQIEQTAKSFDGDDTNIDGYTSHWNGSMDPNNATEYHAHRTGNRLCANAAFFAYCMGNMTIANEAKKFVLRQANNSGAISTLNSSSMWGSALSTHPMMDIAPAMRDWAFSFSWLDFLGIFTSTERNQCLSFAQKVGDWFMGWADKQMKTECDLVNGEWVPHSDRTGISTGDQSRMWYQGEYENSIAKVRFTNRFITAVATVGTMGALLDDTDHINFFARYYRAWLKWAVYPNHAITDMYREFKGSSHEGGIRYALNLLGHLVTAMDVLLRKGHVNLFEYETTVGLNYSKGAPKSPSTLTAKSMLSAWESMSFYFEEILNRRGNDGKSYGNANRLEGIRETSKIHYAEYTWAVQPLVYYRKYTTGAKGNAVKALERMALLTGQAQLSGFRPKTDYQKNGRNIYTEGDQGTYPGMHFMFGLPEVDPYPSGV